jgi:hypothetical protein
MLSVTQNEGARLSDSSYGTLVDKSIDDEVLAICVGMRKDIPREHFRTLISKASEVVLEKVTAGNRAAVAEVARGLDRHHRVGSQRSQARTRRARSAARQVGRRRGL